MFQNQKSAEMETLLSPLGAPCSAPPWSTLAAVDLESGDIIWQVPFGTLRNLAPWPVSRMKGGIEMGGPMVTASGLIFIAASFDAYFRAFDIETGEPLKKDSKGQARRLKGEEIPIYGRVVAIADVYDALATERVYKEAWEEPKILEAIRQGAGTHFDPELVEIFFESLDLLRSIQKRYTDAD